MGRQVCLTMPMSEKLELELGNPPYGELAPNNRLLVGSCEKVAAGPKF